MTEAAVDEAIFAPLTCDAPWQNARSALRTGAASVNICRRARRRRNNHMQHLVTKGVKGALLAKQNHPQIEARRSKLLSRKRRGILNK